jgi:N-acetyl sugar amidotransferase
MDTTDPDITFDEGGVCSHCHLFDARMARVAEMRANPARYVHPLLAAIKNAGRGRPYDCVLGVSGGVDSTYAAYVAKELGLRPLAVHLDNGWNSTIAVTNIYNCLSKLGFDLHTEVLDWDEFRNLQLAFLRASTPDSEIPTDHAIGAVLLRQALRVGVRHIIAGQNVDTEGMAVRAWSTGYHDWRYIQGLQKRFGAKPLLTFPHYSVWQHAWWKVVRRLERVDILNYVPFTRSEARKIITKELGWQDYGGKHHESIYTRFFQSYILPTKFGYDKRLFHLSPLVLTGDMTRDQALAEVARPAYDEHDLARDREFVLKKLGLDDAEFETIMRLPRKTIADYPSYERTALYRLGLRFYKVLPGSPQ